MGKVLEIELNNQNYKFKDKKEVFAFIEKKPSLLNELNDKYIKTKNYKHIKNFNQYVFNYFSGKEDIDFSGSCIMCRKDTDFNLLTNKYCRLCSPKCTEDYKEQFKSRMKGVHGREYYTQDPEALKHMLNNREITQEYKIGNYKFNAVGNFEVDFLDFMFHILKCNPADLIECPFNIEYEFGGVKRIYMPDFYIPSLNLVIEIKSTKSAYADRDKEFEEAKRKAGTDYMRKKGGHYFYLADKDYRGLLEYLKKIIDKS